MRSIRLAIALACGIRGNAQRAAAGRADRGGFIGNRSTGTATVYLRNLGCNRTPVLIGGRRLMPGDPTIGGAAPDLNFISNSLVERVECSPGRLGLCLVPQDPAGRAMAP